MWSSASSNELRMSLPIAATGPLNVETKPILIVFCCGIAGATLSSMSAVVPSSTFFIR